MESKPKQSCERPVDVCAYYHTDPIPCAVNLLAPGARPLPLPPDTTHTQVNINKPPETLQSDCVQFCICVPRPFPLRPRSAPFSTGAESTPFSSTLADDRKFTRAEKEKKTQCLHM